MVAELEADVGRLRRPVGERKPPNAMDLFPCQREEHMMGRLAWSAAVAIAVTGAALAADDPPRTLAEPPAPVKPSEYLASLAKPVFRKGHTLPPLTRYGWTMSFETRVALARDWGYALEFGGYVTEKSAEKLDDPRSVESRLVKLAAADPKTYKLSVVCSRRLPTKEAPPEAWTRDANGLFLNGKAQSMDGTKWHEGMRAIYSPAAPDAVWKLAGQYRSDPIRRVRAKCPIAIVLNGGEYGLGVLGFSQRVWEKDPRIAKDRGKMPWYEYLSRRKARAEMLIATAVRKAVPDRQLYIYYPTTGGTHRNRGGGWGNWMYGYEWMKPVSDLASSEHYYMHFNSGWTGRDNLLTQALNARGFEIANGQPLCYDWLCAGWPRKKGLGSSKPLADGGLGDLSRYAGFLKCLYVAGMVGGNAGYYAYPKGGFAKPFGKDAPPHWLRQMVVFSRVHALFSHLEADIRDANLLPGPDKHVWSKDQPAFELPTGTADVRVLARKRKRADAWLVVAWAAGGNPRDVTVELPIAGRVKLHARPFGSVYRVTKAARKTIIHLVDANPARPATQPALVIRSHPVTNADAARIVPALRRMLREHARCRDEPVTITVDKARNALTVTARPAVHAVIEALLAPS